MTDTQDGLPQALLLGLTGRGFLWAAGAVLVALWAPTLRRAGVVGAMTLVGATAFYYGCILVLTDRWRAGIPIDGSSPLAVGLQSVARASLFWLAASVVVGGLLGMAGWLARYGDVRWAGLVSGALAGVLASGGIHVLISGTAIRIDDWWWVRPGMAALTAAASLCGGTVIIARRDTGQRSWLMFVAGALAALVICVPLWHVVTAVRTSYL